MRPASRFLILLSLLIASIDASSNPLHVNKKICNKIEKDTTLTDDSSFSFITTKYKAAINRLHLQAAAVRQYAKANNFNSEYCFLVDMSLPSGKNRFFVYNIKKDSVEYSSLVAHGFGSYKGNGNDELEFSNIPNSFKTSLGKYKIGNSYYGAFGLAYKLYGLDSTNSNAYQRAIVLHSYSSMPSSETYPERICESAGCPMVNASFLVTLGKYIKSANKPILLWIYN